MAPGLVQRRVTNCPSLPGIQGVPRTRLSVLQRESPRQTGLSAPSPLALSA